MKHCQNLDVGLHGIHPDLLFSRNLSKIGVLYLASQARSQSHATVRRYCLSSSSANVRARKLLHAWAATGAIKEPRHSRNPASTIAMAPNAGTATQPWGCRIAKMNDTMAALRIQLHRWRR